MATFQDPKLACKIIIAGSRTFDDYAFLEKKMNKLTMVIRDIIVVSGTARGADALGEKWAYSWWWTVMRFHPQIDKYGSPKAFFIRNQEMVDFADRAVFFWDGKSTGTKDCIARVKRKGIPHKVYLF